MDKDELPVIAGPSQEDYGFWNDSNMMLNDFEGEELSGETFEKMWEKYWNENGGHKPVTDIKNKK